MRVSEVLLTTSDVGTVLRMSRSGLAYWRRHGLGPPWLKLHRTIRYSRKGLSAWLQQRDGRRAQAQHALSTGGTR